MSTVPQFSVYPSRSDSPETFADDGDQFLSEMSDVIDGFNTVAGEVNANADAAASSASDAATSAGEAAASASDAAGSALAAADSASDAAASAATALAAPGTLATDASTSRTIGTGSFSFTIQTGKNIVPSMWLLAAATSDVTKWMVGQVTAYNSATGALSMTVPASGATNGSGTFSSWQFSLHPALATNIAWSQLTGTPTTVAGYGITDSGLVLLATASPSGAATVDFTSGIDSTYDEYELHLINVVPSSSGAIATVVHSVDGGANWLSAYSLAAVRQTGSSLIGDSGNYSAISLSGSSGVTTTSCGINGVVRIFNPSASAQKLFNFAVSCVAVDGLESSNGTARSTNTSAMNALRFAFVTANATGKLKLFGVRK